MLYIVYDVSGSDKKLTTPGHGCVPRVLHLPPHLNSRAQVALDEMGKGTEPSQGAGIAAATLEELDHTGVRGIFATHFHDILRLDGAKNARHVQYMCMEVSRSADGQNKPTWKVVDGTSEESLAIDVARNAGIPEKLLVRLSPWYMLWQAPWLLCTNVGMLQQLYACSTLVWSSGSIRNWNCKSLSGTFLRKGKPTFVVPIFFVVCIHPPNALLCTCVGVSAHVER